MVGEGGAHQKLVGQDAAEHARLHYTNLAILERDDADLHAHEHRSAPRTAIEPAQGLWRQRTMSSIALPKVALSKPPTVCPSFADSSSVAKLNNDASGMMAKKLSVKIVVGFHPAMPATMPKGTKNSSTLT